ncbi:MAG TPA: hypothetical protein VH684_11115 [Xanthobacteraceae bacterium]|jgi:hypothetical protein
MNRPLALALLGIAVSAGSAAFLGLRAPAKLAAEDHLGGKEPVFTEAKWPFPIDQWGSGRAFVCNPANCGAKVKLYIRPKVGFCNCATGVADDPELERVGDIDLVTRQAKPRAPGRPVKVGWMSGRSRAYAAADGETGENLLSVAFNDECDVVVALAALGDSDPESLEPGLLAFLNTTPMLLWVKKELGLEFVRRDW